MYFSLLALPAQRNFVLLRLPDDDSSPALKSHGFLVIGIKKINALLTSSDVDSKDKTYLNGLLVSAKWNKIAIDFYNKSRNK